jgi:putative ABC transport system permease protein
MVMGEILRVAFTSIRGNLFRAALTMLGVIIGVGAVIAMLALGTGAQRAIDEQLESLGANVITVTTWMRFAQGVAREQVLTTDDAEAVRAGARDVSAVAPEQSSRQQVKLGNRNLNLSVIGTTPEHLVVNGYTMLAGRMLTPNDDASHARVAVLGGEVPEQLQVDAQDLVGRQILVKAMPFEVVGVYEKKGSIGPGNPDDDVFIPIRTSRYRVTGDDRIQSIAVQVAPGVDLARAMVEVERVIRREHGLAPGADNDFSIIDRKQFLATQQQTTQILSFLLAGIAGVSLVVGGIGIMNIMLVTVTERTREIGIRKALGATRRNILAQFLVESLVLCLLGGVIGMLLGIGVARGLTALAGWQTYVSLDALVLAFGFSAAVGLLFGLWPAWRAARLDPIAALRYE